MNVEKIINKRAYVPMERSARVKSVRKLMSDKVYVGQKVYLRDLRCFKNNTPPNGLIQYGPEGKELISLDIYKMYHKNLYLVKSIHKSEDFMNKIELILLDDNDKVVESAPTIFMPEYFMLVDKRYKISDIHKNSINHMLSIFDRAFVESISHIKSEGLTINLKDTIEPCFIDNKPAINFKGIDKDLILKIADLKQFLDNLNIEMSYQIDNNVTVTEKWRLLKFGEGSPSPDYAWQA